MFKQLLLFHLLCFFGISSIAHMRLFEWHAQNTLAPFIISVRETETPEQAISRYTKNLEKSADLLELFAGRVPHFETIRIKQIVSEIKEANPRVLLQTNRPADYSINSERIERFKYYFGKLKQKTFLLPISPTLGLNFKEQKEVFDLIYENFGTYVGLGGDDVSPELARQENYHSRNANADRDAAEIKLVKHFVSRGQEEKRAEKKSFYLGVCRGSQLASVALGYKLIQDISVQVEHSTSHENSWHEIKVLPTSNSLLKKAALGLEKLAVNSLHHQAVIFKPGGFLQLAAISPEGVVEATEFKNGKGLLVQFHPELMKNAAGFQVLATVIRHKDQFFANQCHQLF